MGGCGGREGGGKGYIMGVRVMVERGCRGMGGGRKGGRVLLSRRDSEYEEGREREKERERRVTKRVGDILSFAIPSCVIPSYSTL